MMTMGRYQSFEPVAESYDRTRVIPDRAREEIARVVAREARLAGGGLFLDAGVGTGRLAVPLARRHPGQVVGIDIAPAMLARVGDKDGAAGLSLVQGDLQRLPFAAGTFRATLMVHILHLIEQWPLVLHEVKRVLTPKDGVLFLGVEQGGRSRLVDFYYERARARRLLAPSVGSASLAPVVAALRRPTFSGGFGASVSQLSTPSLHWERVVPVAQTYDALASRTYSQMWSVPDAAHAELLSELTDYAARTFRGAAPTETLASRLLLYAVRF